MTRLDQWESQNRSQITALHGRASVAVFHVKYEMQPTYLPTTICISVLGLPQSGKHNHVGSCCQLMQEYDAAFRPIG